MVTTAKTELRELARLVAETERYDATLAAKPEVVRAHNAGHGK